LNKKLIWMNAKIKLLILVMGLAVTSSYGSVKVYWTGSAGFFFSANPSVGILGDATGHSTFAQLIYSVDIYADAAGIGGATTGDDVVWDILTLSENGISDDYEGGTWDSFAWFTTGDYQQANFVTGHVYARIFQDSGAEVGDWYFYTPMLELEDITGIAFNQRLEMNTPEALANLTGDAVDSGPTVAQVVPEPAAIGLIGLGGIVTLTASRFRRRNTR
jgi:hypothetical protein